MAKGLQSARLKMLRAMKQGIAVDASIAEYAARKTYAITADADGKEEFSITEEAPPDIPIMLGEIVYHYRSALDHLFFDLVKINHAHGVLLENWESECQFPLATKGPDGVRDGDPVPRKHFKKTLNGLTDRAFAFVESMQPYYERNELLFLLTKLSNIDKHRRLSTTLTTFTRHDDAVTAEGWSSTFITPFLQSNTKLYPPDHPAEVAGRAVNMETKFVPEIAFDEPTIGPPEAWPISLVTRQMAPFMLTRIYPAFCDLIGAP